MHLCQSKFEILGQIAFSLVRINGVPDEGHYQPIRLNAENWEVIMKKHERIDINPNVMFGKPVIKNTRIAVEHILRKLSTGMTIDDIIEDHPHLRAEDIFAAQEFAADYLASEEIAFG